MLQRKLKGAKEPIPYMANESGYHSHRDDDAPWKDEETLRAEYEEKSIPELASQWDVSQRTIQYWKDKLGVESKSRGRGRRVERASYSVGSDGHPRWQGAETEHVSIHQLTAIAEGVGPEKVFSGGDYHIHHINNVPWDNRPENLKILPRRVHTALTHLERLSEDEREEVLKLVQKI